MSDFHLYYDGDDDDTPNKKDHKKQEDDDLNQAIQLSLQQPQPTYSSSSSSYSFNKSQKEKSKNNNNNYNNNNNDKNDKNNNDFSVDEEDVDLKQAIQNSLQDSVAFYSPPSPDSSPSSFSSSSSSFPSSFPSSSSSSSSPSPHPSSTITSTASPRSEEETKSRPAEWAWYLNRLPGYSKEANSASISIRDIVTESGLTSCLITTYELELDWLLRQCPVLSSVPVTMVHGEKHPQALPQPPASMTYHKPNLPLQWGVHHGKMFVLYYPHFVRVAITTANLIMIDYEKKSQGIWMQDFPKKDPQQKYIISDFESTLVDYVSKLGVSYEKIQQYDFSIANVVLVTSVPGYHRGYSLHRYGHMKVRAALQREKMDPKFKNAPVACQFSSTGSLTKDWLVEELFGSLTASGGYNGNSESDHKDNKEVPTFGKDKKRSRDERDVLPNAMKIVWPTVEFVRNSIDGWASGGSLCFPAKNFKGFFQELNLFHSYISFKGRENVPPHIKTYSRYLDNGELAWNYLTSANLSKAAMGELQKNGTQMMMRHYEIGVLFLPSLYNLGQKEPATFFTQQYYHNLENGKHNDGPPSHSSKSIGIPLPYILPPNVYTHKDEPWLWDNPQNAPDVFGKRWLC